MSLSIRRYVVSFSRDPKLCVPYTTIWLMHAVTKCVGFYHIKHLTPVADMLRRTPPCSNLLVSVFVYKTIFHTLFQTSLSACQTMCSNKFQGKDCQFMKLNGGIHCFPVLQYSPHFMDLLVWSNYEYVSSFYNFVPNTLHR